MMAKVSTKKKNIAINTFSRKSLTINNGEMLNYNGQTSPQSRSNSVGKTKKQLKKLVPDKSNI